MSKTILDMFGLEKVSVLDPSAAYATVSPPVEVIESDLEVGIEVEVENHILTRTPTGVWASKGDGSLRNNGIEWITRPIPAKWAPYALRELLEESLSGECCFSPRTSIHVHFNVQSFTSAEVVDATLLYTALEPLFYKFTGRGRIKNIYCVPLMDTNLITGMNGQTLNNTIEAWSKYTGLNLLPVRELGTMEARHMHGTFDHRKISIWIRMWIKLLDYVRKMGTAHMRRMFLDLHQYTDYQQLLNDIFGADALMLKYESWDDLSRSVGVVKRAFINLMTVVGLVKGVSKKSPYFKAGA